MKISAIKTSFAAGQWGASLYGRTDVAHYENACSIVENMLVRPYGSVISTPGTWLVSEAKESAAGTDSTLRLIPFVFSRTDSYVIEMGPKYFRFYTDRGQVLSGASAYEVAHCYSEAELDDVQHTQLNDIIWFAHPNHAPRRLIRSGAASWTFSEYDFLGGPFLDDNTSTITINPSSTTGSSITLTLSATSSSIYFTASGSTVGHVGSYWKIGSTVSGSTIRQGYVKILSVTSPSTATATVMDTLSSAAATTNWAEGAWNPVKGYPARVVFHEQRLWWARTDHEPQGIWGSHIGIYDDYSLNLANDDEGINIKVASNEANEIQWLASGNKSLIAGTYGGAFIISSGTGETLTPSNINARQEISQGAKSIPPKRIGNFFYYVQRFGKIIRELFYQWESDGHKAIDKTILCPEITDTGVKDMAYQEITDTLLWCVKSNGTIAVLTREVDQEVQGWSTQTTDGEYESICSIPSQTYEHDEIWVVVKRTINGNTKRYIEVFEDINPPDLQDDCLYLHSALTYNAYLADTAASISLSATAGTITITASTTILDDEEVGRRIRAIDSDETVIGECKITANSSGTLTCRVTKEFDTTAYDAGSWGVSAKTISGLDHLEAKSVKVLGDGGTDLPDKTVSSGSITLEYDYFKVNIGLPYTQKLETLPFEVGGNRGTAQGKKQRIYQVAFKINNSYKGFRTGGDSDLAEKISFRDPSTLMGSPEELFTGVLSNINFRDDYRYGARVYIENSDPLPIEILSIMVDLETFDK